MFSNAFVPCVGCHNVILTSVNHTKQVKQVFMSLPFLWSTVKQVIVMIADSSVQRSLVTSGTVLFIHLFLLGGKYLSIYLFFIMLCRSPKQIVDIYSL